MSFCILDMPGVQQSNMAEHTSQTARTIVEKPHGRQTGSLAERGKRRNQGRQVAYIEWGNRLGLLKAPLESHLVACPGAWPIRHQAGEMMMTASE